MIEARPFRLVAGARNHHEIYCAQEKSDLPSAAQVSPRRGRLVMKLVAATVAVALVLFAGLAVHAQTPTDPEGVFRATIAAFNAGDAAASASYFSEDATLTRVCPPAGTCRGRAEIQAALEREIAEGVQAEIRSLTVDGDTLTIQLAESAPGFAELGIERVYINITAIVQNGKITSMADELDLTDSQTATFAAALEEETQGELPATGTGFAPGPVRSQWWLFLALLTLGAGWVAAGLTLRNMRR